MPSLSHTKSTNWIYWLLLCVYHHGDLATPGYPQCCCAANRTLHRLNHDSAEVGPSQMGTVLGVGPQGHPVTHLSFVRERWSDYRWMQSHAETLVALMSQIGMSSVNKAYRRRRFERSLTMLDKYLAPLYILWPFDGPLLRKILDLPLLTEPYHWEALPTKCRDSDDPATSILPTERDYSGCNN